jgi:hypothetical protein
LSRPSTPSSNLHLVEIADSRLRLLLQTHIPARGQTPMLVA